MLRDSLRPYNMKDWKDILYESLEDKSIPQWILDIEAEATET